MLRLFGVRRRLGALVLGFIVIPLAACDDERGDPLGPNAGPLSGDGLFSAALVTTSILRMQNHFAEKALQMLDDGITAPYTEPACEGTGTAVVTVSDTDPNTFLVQFTNYVPECNSHISLTFNSIGTTGAMYITFRQRSPGLVYEITHPYDFAANEPSGTSCQLPSEDGGEILLMSTPLGALRYQLDVPRGTNPGTVSVTGTLRLEDRSTPLLAVAELALDYAFDENLSPKFADWPGGTYEIAAFEGGGGFFGGATPSFPRVCFFDGFGGAAYQVLGHSCQVNLTDREHGNPCAGLD